MRIHLYSFIPHRFDPISRHRNINQRNARRCSLLSSLESKIKLIEVERKVTFNDICALKTLDCGVKLSSDVTSMTTYNSQHKTHVETLSVKSFSHCLLSAHTLNVHFINSPFSIAFSFLPSIDISFLYFFRFPFIRQLRLLFDVYVLSFSLKSS